MPRPSPVLEPRGLSREQAAIYVGVGATLFDSMVGDGRMPVPREVNARRVWDRRELDLFFDSLPKSGEAEPGRNPFDGVNPFKKRSAA